jgi:vancomycin resistance protein VanW
MAVAEVPVVSSATVVESLRADGWPMPPALAARRRRRLGSLHPGLYVAAVGVHRLRRRLRWLTSGAHWAHERTETPLPVRLFKHKSLLMRQLGDTDMWMQHNKVTNLRIAAACTDGLVLRPGETFSFCRTVGKATARRGFVDGMLLSNGQAMSGVGGGICQLANLLYWMVMHSPLTVVERSEHGFDPFPDNNRVIPWGSGAAIYYNYVDLVFRNDTDSTFQFVTRVGERYLEGELRADVEQAHSYSVHARDEQFFVHEGQHFRRNEIWRTVIDRRTGDHLREERLKRNLALVTYVPEQFRQPGDAPATGPLGELVPVREPRWH